MPEIEAFPKLEAISILAPDSSEMMKIGYRHWMVAHLTSVGGQPLNNLFMRVVRALDDIGREPFPTRIFVMAGPTSPRERLTKEILEMYEQLGKEFIPVRELEADLLFRIAETADAFLRYGEAQQKFSEQVLKQLLGVASLEEVVEVMQGAEYVYFSCFRAVVNLALSAKGAEKTQAALGDQLAVKCLSAMTRVLLLKLERALAMNDRNRMSFFATTVNLILPQAVNEPEIWASILTAENFEKPVELVRFTGNNMIFNSHASATAFLVNAAILAMIAREMEVAKRYLKLARVVSGAGSPAEINNLEKLILDISSEA